MLASLRALPRSEFSSSSHECSELILTYRMIGMYFYHDIYFANIFFVSIVNLLHVRAQCLLVISEALDLVPYSIKENKNVHFILIVASL